MNGTGTLSGAPGPGIEGLGSRSVASGQGEDEDRDLGRVGSLERGKPIILFIETLRH
jgi:hypothetical protein